MVLFDHDPVGNITGVTDGRGHTTTTTYDSVFQTFPETVTPPTVNGVSLQTNASYDARWGVVDIAADANGQQTDYDYDGLGRLTDVTDPLGTVTHYNYTDDASGRTVETTLAHGTAEAYTTKSHTNGLGELTRRERDGQSGTIFVDYEYDALGRQTSVSAPYSGGDPLVTTDYAYDALGRTVAITNTDATVRTLDYDSYDTVTIDDENGHRTRRISDGLGRLRQVELFTIGEFGLTFYARTTYTYDPKDDLRQVHHFDDTGSEIAKPVLITTSSLSQKVEMDDPDMGLWRYTYDAAGNLATQTDAKGQTLTFGYDELNRPTGKTYSDGTPPVQYSYDEGQFGKGRRTGMSDASGSAAWAYDALGRVLTETQIIGGAVYATGYTYDRLDRVATMTYPDGEVVTYGYNAQNLVTSLSSSLGDTYLSSANYNSLDQPTLMNLGNGVSTVYGYYDPASTPGQASFRLRTLQTTAPGSVMLQGLSYQYDAVGNITNLDDTVTGRTWLYGYDPFDRLIWAERVPDSLLYDFAYDRLHNLTYRYDPVANIGWELIYPNDPTAPRPHAPLFVTDGDDTLAAFDYDANGNRAADSQRGISYDFDIENRLIQVTGPDETSFAYNGNDQRVSRTVGSGSEAETTLYVGEHYEISAGDVWSTPQTVFGCQITGVSAPPNNSHSAPCNCGNCAPLIYGHCTPGPEM